MTQLIKSGIVKFYVNYFIKRLSSGTKYDMAPKTHNFIYFHILSIDSNNHITSISFVAQDFTLIGP